MNFFKSGIQSVLGTAEPSEGTSGAETVSCQEEKELNESLEK